MTNNTQKDWEGRITLFINDAWSRGANWAMKGRGYAMDTNADREAELAIELVNNLLADARREVEDMAETEMLQIIDERDNAEMWADNLARRLAPPEILGEHSNVNNPWKNAMEYVRPVESLKPIIDVLATLREEEGAK